MTSRNGRNTETRGYAPVNGLQIRSSISLPPSGYAGLKSFPALLRSHSVKVVNNQWAGFSNAELASIKAPILIAVGDHDYAPPPRPT